jgi:hypothetical protein
VRLCIVQMSHNASKSFPLTLLTDVFHQIRNNRFDKEGCIIFRAFRNIQQTFDPCATPNNRNEALFGLHFLLVIFKHAIWICGPVRMTKIFKKGQLSSPVNMYSSSYCWCFSSIWKSSRASLTRDHFWSASSECGT